MKLFRVVVNGSEYKVEIEEINEQGSAQTPAPKSTPAPSPQPAPQPAAAKPAPAAKPAAAQTPAGGAIVAPMPGTVLRVEVNKGDSVTQGQILLVLEAMKMENEIQAPADGVVQELNISEGASVNAGDTLIVLSS
ncbi:MAG: biotin/lipoyl-binding protein [Desulfobulbaceae bacterium]|nr:biotin/lipoyl-binding protein [Desulfobulbaceae bacterium]